MLVAVSFLDLVLTDYINSLLFYRMFRPYL